MSIHSPAKIRTVRILDNPFEDIVPRITAEEKRAQQRAREEAQREREEAAGDEARHDLPHDGHRRGERDAHFRLQGLVERGYDRYDRVRDLDARRELRREGRREAALQLVLQDRGADGDAPRLARAV